MGKRGGQLRCRRRCQCGVQLHQIDAEVLEQMRVLALIGREAIETGAKVGRNQAWVSSRITSGHRAQMPHQGAQNRATAGCASKVHGTAARGAEDKRPVCASGSWEGRAVEEAQQLEWHLSSSTRKGTGS